MRPAIQMIDQLRARPSSLEHAIEVMNFAADEIDRLLGAITNAQSVLIYEAMSPQERIVAALAALAFADK